MKRLPTVLLPVSILAVLALSIFGCAGTGEIDATGPSAGGKTVLNGAGASFPYPLYSKWFSEYSKLHPETQINYQSIGSGGGIQQLKAGTVDFGASDAPLSDRDMAGFPGEVLHLPTVAGAVVVAYNLELEQPLRLDGITISAIYRGEIQRWNDPALRELNPGWALPDMLIAPAFRADGSGTTYIFTNFLSAACKNWAAEIGAGKSVSWHTGMGGKGNEGVAGLVTQTPGAVGYVELAYAEQNNLPAAHIKNPAGNFIEPGLESTTAAAAGAVERMQKDVRSLIVNSPGENAYPIAGFTYLLVYDKQEDAEKGRALVSMLEWAMEKGQEYAPSLLYAPLPPEVVSINEGAIEGIELPQAAQ